MSRLQHQRLTTKALALALLLSALWGGNPVAIKVGLYDCPPFRLGLLRFLLGAVVVMVAALARRESLRVAAVERAPLAGLGLLFSAQIALMNLGQDRTSAGHAAVIMSSYPLWTAVFAHFVIPGDRLTRSRLAGALVAYLGVLTVFAGGSGSEGRALASAEGVSLGGDLLLVGSALLLGARQIVLSRTSQAISITKLLLSQASCGSVSFLFASLVFEREPTRWTPSLAGALAYQGFVIAGFAFLFQTWLLQRFPPSRVTTVYLTQPLFGVVLSYWILGEPVGFELVLGAGLVVFGSYFVQRR